MLACAIILLILFLFFFSLLVIMAKNFENDSGSKASCMKGRMINAGVSTFRACVPILILLCESFCLFRIKLFKILFYFFSLFVVFWTILHLKLFSFFIIFWCIFSATFFGKTVFGWVRFQLLVLFMPLFRNSFCFSSWWKGLVWIEFLSNVSCSTSPPGGNQVDGLPSNAIEASFLIRL